MGILKFSSRETDRLELGEGDFIEVRKKLSKRAFNDLLSAMPNREVSDEAGLTLQEGLKFAEALFEALVVGWSAPEDASLENYLELDNDAASLIDTKLIEHFGTMTPSPEQASKVSTSRGSRRKESLPRV
jgi:hypothetical protein